MPIPVAAAFHSPQVRPAQRPLAELIEQTRFAPPELPVYSNTTARAHPADVSRIRRQMAEHLVRPVEFVAQIEAMHADGARVFVEIGPKSVLTKLVGSILGDRPHLAVSVDDGGGLAGLLAAVGRLVCAGLPLDPTPLFARRDVRVGDPSQPAALLRLEPVSRHAWMLNGSRARRASEPVPVTVGVTLEQAQARSAPTPGATPRAAVTSPVPHAAAVRMPATRPAPQIAASATRSLSNPSYRRSTHG